MLTRNRSTLLGICLAASLATACSAKQGATDAPDGTAAETSAARTKASSPTPTAQSPERKDDTDRQGEAIEQRNSAPTATEVPPEARFDELERRFDTADAFTTTDASSRRILGIGYVRTSYGEIRKQLVVLDIHKGASASSHSNFHREIYKPDKICGTSVNGDNEEERQQVQSALSSLEKGVVPAENPAYEWARGYELLPRHCRGWEPKADSSTSYWEARHDGKRIVFAGTDWDGSRTIQFYEPTLQK